MFEIRFLCLFTLLLTGCYSLPLDPKYKGPTPRPAALDQYYSRETSYGAVNEEIVKSTDQYTLKKISVESSAGQISIDYYQRREPSENIVLVFPVLGGKPVIEGYFADYIANHGIDSAIVNRNNEFKDPKNIDKFEQLIKDSVVRDRYAMDFFERQYGKKQFGSFGISRGAINAAITAGVDDRLKHNVLIMGGSDLAKLFEKTNQKRIKKYIDTVVTAKNITRAEFFTAFNSTLKTDPKNFASYIDASKTLMILGLFDRTVPIHFGRLLREQMGNPKTIFLFADHYTGLLFTNVLKVACGDLCFLPFDYVETESMNFYRNSMNTGEKTLKLIPFRILRIPFDLLGRIGEAIF
jgi:hypothetical protein